MKTGNDRKLFKKIIQRRRYEEEANRKKEKKEKIAKFDKLRN